MVPFKGHDAITETTQSADGSAPDAAGGGTLTPVLIGHPRSGNARGDAGEAWRGLAGGVSDYSSPMAVFIFAITGLGVATRSFTSVWISSPAIGSISNWLFFASARNAGSRSVSW